MKEMMSGMVKDAVKEAIKDSPGVNSRPSSIRPSLASLIKPSLVKPNSQKPSEGQRPASGSTKPFPLSEVSSLFYKVLLFYNDKSVTYFKSRGTSATKQTLGWSKFPFQFNMGSKKSSQMNLLSQNKKKSNFNFQINKFKPSENVNLGKKSGPKSVGGQQGQRPLNKFNLEELQELQEFKNAGGFKQNKLDKSDPIGEKPADLAEDASADLSKN